MSYLLNVTSWPFTFSERIPLSTQRYGAACGLLKNYGVHKNLPIVAGGRGSSTSMLTTEILINSRWEPGPNLPRDFAYGGYTNVNGFFLVGGVDLNGIMMNYVMMYDEETQQFKITEGKMETGRHWTAIVSSTNQCD